jgi:alkanesulfonate monooxygenase
MRATGANMLTAYGDLGLRVFSTCPQSTDLTADAYLKKVQEIARWSEDAGCEGILVYTDNAQVDPWLTSQAIITATRSLCPLVAIQPVYMHPYSVAKMISSLAFLHGRRVYLNMVAGGFPTDLAALNDRTPHDERYTRLAEYTAIIQGLLQSAGPFSYDGKYYQVQNLRLTPPLPSELLPGILMSGSSEAGTQAARSLGALPIEYPKPVAEYAPAPPDSGAARGLRIGLITRDTETEAWRDAHARFPSDRKGQLAHELAMKVSDSSWHRQLSKLGANGAGAERNPYWLVPFQNSKTFCPYLVGSYPTVAQEIAGYFGAGYRTFILDIPSSAEELRHTGIVFGLAVDRLAA